MAWDKGNIKRKTKDKSRKAKEQQGGLPTAKTKL